MRELAIKFQSTRPYGARRCWHGFQHGKVVVSIHAPVRGATHFGAPNSTPASLFQSTRPYGARRTLHRRRTPSLCFNPRARTGRDSTNLHADYKTFRVSIHAPVRGATSSACRLRMRFRMFQSTRPYGARHCDRCLRSASLSFNPRARTGRDLVGLFFMACSF